MGNPLHFAIYYSKADLVRLLLSYKAFPTLSNVTTACCDNDNLEVLKAILDVEKVVDEVIQNLHDYRVARGSTWVWNAPPFMALLRSGRLSPTEKLKWLDYMLTKFKHDNCYFCPLPINIYCTPLAMVLADFTGIQKQSDKEVPEFGYQVVKKLVEHGSSLSAVATHCETCGEEQTVEPLLFPYTTDMTGLLFGGTNAFERTVGSKTLRYLCQQGATLSEPTRNQVMGKFLMKSPLSPSMMSSLGILTEGGVIQPERTYFGELFVNWDKIGQPLHFLKYVMIVSEELGSAVTGSDWDKAITKEKTKLSGKSNISKSLSPLKVLARHAVRQRLITAQEEKSTMNKTEKSEINMNSLIDLIGVDVIPSHLKDYLKLEGFTAKLRLSFHESAVAK